MRDSILFSFNFWFINEKGKLHHWIPKLGHIGEQGLKLDNQLIFFEDIYQVDLHQKHVIISLYPFSTLSKKLHQLIIPEHQTLVIKVMGSNGKDVESLIDHTLAHRVVEEEKSKMSAVELKNDYKEFTCNSCGSKHNVTQLPLTHYFYCHYCETITTQHGDLTTGNQRYGICPETGYFDRLSYYKQYEFYYLIKEKKFSVKKLYAGDVVAELSFKDFFLKNLTLIYGSVFTLIEWMKCRKNRNPDFIELGEANMLAEKGAIAESSDLYFRMLMRIPNFPGIHHNLGLLYWRNHDQEQALKHFERALEGCANYTPTKEFLERYGTKKA